jgi:hypothetical protein
MDLGEVGWGNVDWIGLAKDRNRWRALVNSVLNLWVPLNAGKLSSGLASSSLSSSAQLLRERERERERERTLTRLYNGERSHD